MDQDFNYSNNIRATQTRLISQSIRDTANLDFLKSEDALQEIIKSYRERFKVKDGVLFDAAKYVAKSAEIIKLETFNDLFESIFIDLSALYSDLDSVNSILDLNLNRNKNYFLVIKKRIRDLWNKLNYTRTLVYDDIPSDKTYYESFSTKANASLLENVEIDKKGGFLHLVKEFTRTLNNASIIKSVTSTTYPENNDYGGVRYTGSELNTFIDNYTNGPRDMLENGLWKEQIICNDIPDMNINIGSDSYPIYRCYRGIVSIVDIEYVYPVDINRLDLDLYGDSSTKIDTVLYIPVGENNTYESGNWKTTTYVSPNLIPLDPTYYNNTSIITGEAFDLINFYNISKIKTNRLRIVFNQENYVHMESRDTQQTVDSKIQEDLAERRYATIKFGSDLDDLLARPINDSNTSLYYKIIDIIESTRNIDIILDKIDNLLDPKLKVFSYDFERTLKYDIGAWSIEPKRQKYSRALGVFNSVKYSIPDKSLLSVSINTEQSTPKSTCANWYIGIGGKNIPILENKNHFRKEPLLPFDISSYSSFSDWVGGTFFLLDCPINPLYPDYIYISTNGSSFTKASDIGTIAFLNSRLIYINSILDPFEATYTVCYPVAAYSSVNLYVLRTNPGTDANVDITLDVVSSRYEVIKAFVDDSHNTYSGSKLSEIYGISSVLSTQLESQLWFGQNFSTCLFVGDLATRLLSITSTYDPIKSSAISKASCTNTDLSNYLASINTGLSDLSLIGRTPNVAPQVFMRDV